MTLDFTAEGAIGAHVAAYRKAIAERETQTTEPGRDDYVYSVYYRDGDYRSAADSLAHDAAENPRVPRSRKQPSRIDTQHVEPAHGNA